MRGVLLLVLTMTLATPAAIAQETEADREVANLVAVRTVATGAILAWEPTPGASGYAVYRLEGQNQTLLGETKRTTFFDPDAPERASYVVIALDAPGNPPPPPSGACVTASTKGASVTARNCMPPDIWDWTEA